MGGIPCEGHPPPPASPPSPHITHHLNPLSLQIAAKQRECSTHQHNDIHTGMKIIVQMEASWEAVLFGSEDDLCCRLNKNNLIRIYQIILKWMVSLTKIWHVRVVCLILIKSFLFNLQQSSSSLSKRTASQLASICTMIFIPMWKHKHKQTDRCILILSTIVRIASAHLLPTRYRSNCLKGRGSVIVI